MDMQVMNGLPGPLADVDADIVTIGVVFFLDNIPPPGNQRPEFFAFVFPRFKIIGEMPIGDDEKMTLTDRVAIPCGKAEVSFDD